MVNLIGLRVVDNPVISYLQFNCKKKLALFVLLTDSK